MGGSPSLATGRAFSFLCSGILQSMNNTEKDPIDKALSIPGRLRLAAELVSAIPGLPEDERADVALRAVSLIQSASEELIAGALEQNQRSTARAAERLLEMIRAGKRKREVEA